MTMMLIGDGGDNNVENVWERETFGDLGRDPFNQNPDRSDREKRTTSKGGPVFSKLFRLDRTNPLSFGPKFPEILVEWIAPLKSRDYLFCSIPSPPYQPTPSPIHTTDPVLPIS